MVKKYNPKEHRTLIECRIDDNSSRKLGKYAERESRSLSNFVAKILTEYIEWRSKNDSKDN